MKNYFRNSLIDVKQLKEIIDNPNLRILDCTFPFKKGSFLYKNQRIQNSIFVDVSELRDTSSNLTMSFPKPGSLKFFLKNLNISKNNCIVCYDHYGIYTSPRIWFILKAYGFPHVSVLNGGFPKWLSSGYEIDNEKLSDDNFDNNLKKIYDFDNDKQIENDEYSINQNILATFQEVLDNTKTKNSLLIDTRHSMNYMLDNIPNSINIPFMSFTNEDKTMKSKEQLENLFDEYNIDNIYNSEIISSCGVGLTACLGVLAFKGVMGINEVKLYDGSFEEYSNIMSIDKNI